MGVVYRELRRRHEDARARGCDGSTAWRRGVRKHYRDDPMQLVRLPNAATDANANSRADARADTRTDSRANV